MPDHIYHLSFELELKDEAILLGDFHKITTDEFNETNTTNFTAVQFQVVKKELTESNKIKYVSERVVTLD